RAKACVLDAGNGAVSLEGAADDAEHGIECLDRRLVERMENAIAERCAPARAVSLTVRRPLCGELLSPDRWLSDRKNGSRRRRGLRRIRRGRRRRLASQRAGIKCGERPDQDARLECADHGQRKGNLYANPQGTGSDFRWGGRRDFTRTWPATGRRLSV